MDFGVIGVIGVFVVLFVVRVELRSVYEFVLIFFWLMVDWIVMDFGKK